eukprot:scaffold55338_cov32-Tisochrysis_lutea.AAC.5
MGKRARVACGARIYLKMRMRHIQMARVTSSFVPSLSAANLLDVGTASPSSEISCSVNRVAL